MRAKLQRNAGADRVEGQLRQRASRRRARHHRARAASRSPVNPLTAVKLGVEETWFVIERTMSYLGGVIVGKESADQLGGPIRIAQVSGQVATAGFVALIHLAAVLSISIGLLNLFPVPLLDGGHLLFYAIEAIRGRPLSDRAHGIRVPLRPRLGASVNDICDLQRHSPPVPFVTVAIGQRIDTKRRSAAA